MENEKIITEEQLLAALFLRGQKVVTYVDLSKIVVSFCMYIKSYRIYEGDFRKIYKFITGYRELGIMIKDEYNLDVLITHEKVTLSIRNYLISIAGATAINFCELYYRNCFNCSNNNACRRKHDVNGFPLGECNEWENDVKSILSLKKTDLTIYPQKKEYHE